MDVITIMTVVLVLLQLRTNKVAASAIIKRWYCNPRTKVLCNDLQGHTDEISKHIFYEFCSADGKSCYTICNENIDSSLGGVKCISYCEGYRQTYCEELHQQPNSYPNIQWLAGEEYELVMKTSSAEPFENKLFCNPQTDVDCTQLHTQSNLDENKKKLYKTCCYISNFGRPKSCYSACNDMYPRPFGNCHIYCSEYQIAYCNEQHRKPENFPDIAEISGLLLEPLVRWICRNSSCRISQSSSGCYIDRISNQSLSCAYLCDSIGVEGFAEQRCDELCPGFLEESCRLSRDRQVDSEGWLKRLAQGDSYTSIGFVALISSIIIAGILRIIYVFLTPKHS